MEDIQLNVNEKGKGKFFIMDQGEQVAEMEVSISDHDITVFHTEVSPKAEGKGLAKQLLASMVNYARSGELKVIPLCPFVLAQFKRHPKEYDDVWSRNQHLNNRHE